MCWHLGLLKLGDELRPADVGHAHVLVLQAREANVHQYLAQTVVHKVQHEAFCQRLVGRRRHPRLKRLFIVQRAVCLRGRQCEQLSGGVEQWQLFEGGAVKAKGSVVVLRRNGWPTGGADGAEVQDVLAPFPHRGHLPGFGRVVRWGPAGRGRDQVAAAVFNGRLEGERLVWTVVLMQLCIPQVLEGGGV